MHEDLAFSQNRCRYCFVTVSRPPRLRSLTSAQTPSVQLCPHLSSSVHGQAAPCSRRGVPSVGPKPRLFAAESAGGTPCWRFSVFPSHVRSLPFLSPFVFFVVFEWMMGSCRLTWGAWFRRLPRCALGVAKLKSWLSGPPYKDMKASR